MNNDKNKTRANTRPRSSCSQTRTIRWHTQLHDATAVLGDFIHDQAKKTEAELGFGYVLKSDAPNVYPNLQRAFRHSVETGEPLQISSENSDGVIYADPSVNFALRFWHDVNHVRRGLSFDLVDELELSLWHLGELEAGGHHQGSLVWQLLHADLTGGIYVQAFTRRFPWNQQRFVTGCVTSGFDHGLLHELRTGEADAGHE